MRWSKSKQRRPAKKKKRRKRGPAQPRNFKEHLLAIPKDDGEFERMKIEFREVDFGEP